MSAPERLEPETTPDSLNPFSRWRMTALERIAGVRGQHPRADHAIRASQRFSDARGSLFTAGVTYYGFLAAFPLLALIYASLSVIAKALPSLEDDLNDALEEALPDIAGDEAGQVQISGEGWEAPVIAIVSLCILLYAGWKWVLTLRWSLHQVADVTMPRHGRAAILGILRDLAVLAILGFAFMASLLASVILVEASSWVIQIIPFDGPVQRALASVVAFVVVFFADAVLAAIILRGLSGARPPWRPLIEAAVMWAIGFSILKLGGTLIISSFTNNPLYGSFALTIGVLVWINWSSRWLLWCGAWAVTSTPEDERPLTLRRKRKGAEPTSELGQPADDDASGATPDAADDQHRAAKKQTGADEHSPVHP